MGRRKGICSSPLDSDASLRYKKSRMKKQASVQVNLFNTPNVSKNGTKILFSLRKAEALFYYLVVNKQATRDELASLLWGEWDEKTAKKNLRNALYTIRRAFDLEIVTSLQKQVVMLNPVIPMGVDLDIFLKNKTESIKAYSGEFLQGFLVKDAEDFMEWQRGQADFLRQSYITMLYTAIEKSQAGKNEKKAEHFAKLLINTDVFEEKAYRILMQIYAEKGAFHKALEIFNKLAEILDKELGIAPEAKTKELYYQIMDMRKTRARHGNEIRGDFFYGRRHELQVLTDGFKEFIEGKPSRFILIGGEPGIGKSRLKDEFIKHIDQNEVYLFETNSYQAEEGYFLKPWNKIFSQLYQIIAKENISVPLLWKNIAAYLFPIFATEYAPENINPMEKLDSIKPKVIDDAVINVLNSVSRKKKIVLIFEDLQWIDTMSLSLLNNILLPREYNHIFFIGTLRDGYRDEIDKFLTILSKYNRLKRIDLQRFSQKEVSEFISQALPSQRISRELKTRLYKETEGNAFFLWEYLNILREKRNIPSLTARMQDILKSRVIDISQEGKKILNIISLFFDEVPLELLAEVSGKNELMIMDLIEELKNKSLVKEIESHQCVGYTFTHHKLREFIYSQQSLGRRRILHNKIGLLLEQKLQNNKRDYLAYPSLIYHFSHAGKGKATLNYCLKNAKVYLDISHELFPELSDPASKGNRYLQITREIAVKYLEEIGMLLDEVRAQETISSEIKCMEIVFLHMFGRFLIREGEYKKGINLIQQVIHTALEIQNWEYALRGYKQLIFYAIQTHNVKLMDGYLDSALGLAKKHHLRKDLGTVLRLKGLNRIMSGRYEEAEKLFKESLDIFTKMDQSEKYSLCVAAVHNYMGEIRRHKQEYSQALACYDQAIAISKDKEVISSLAIFHTNAGQAAFENQDFKKAKIYLKKAMELYSQFDSHWGRSIAEGFSAMLLIRNGQYHKALSCLQRADLYAQKLKSPYELSLVQRVKTDITTIMNEDRRLKDIFSSYLQAHKNLPKNKLS